MDNSLDIVRAELDVRMAEQERRGAAFDSRAGLVMGFSGLLIGIAPGQPTLLQLLAQLLAAGAAAVAGWVLLPRQGKSLGIRELRDRYLAQPAAFTSRHVLDVRLWLSERDDELIHSKARRLTGAARLLGGSVILMVGSSILEYIR